MDLFLQLTVNGAMIGVLYALVALGFVFIVKGSGVINFAQGHLVLVGGYVVAWLTADLQLPLAVALPLAIVLMVVLGLTVERFALRPLENEPLLSLVMATVAIGIVLEGLTFFAWGEQVRRLPQPFPTEPLFMGNVRIQQLNLWSMLLALVAMGACGWFLNRSRMGLAMQAVSEDRVAAQSLGVNVRRVNAAAWAVSGALAAIGGWIWGSILGVGSFLTVIGLFFVFPVVILGGLESVLGALIGGILVGVVQNLAGGYLDPIVGGGFSTNVAPALLLLLILLVRPHGLFGRPEIERV